MIDRVLDYRPAYDERNQEYPVSALFGAGALPGKTYMYWKHGETLDQGREGACVGFGWTAELMASPVRVKLGNPDAYARMIYRTAQMIDEYPGESYEGTSVLAGAKVVQSAGLIEEYRWAFTVEDIIRTVIEVGPVVVGIPWYYSMYETRPSGLVESLGQPGDSMVGGHCLLLTGYSPKRRFLREGIRNKFEVIRWQNSWGRSYGLNGAGYIRVEDFERLFTQFGEACVPLVRKLPAETL